MKLKVNTASLSAKIEALESSMEEKVLRKILKVGEDAVWASPVDTGAFVGSWSILPKGSGGGRSKSSKGKPRKQNRSVIQKQHISTELPKDITRHGKAILAKGGAVVRNRAPHAQAMKPRAGPNLGQILATVKDKNR